MDIRGNHIYREYIGTQKGKQALYSKGVINQGWGTPNQERTTKSFTKT
jgi:hypothetical protein